MDAIAALRTIGGLGTVLGLLAGALWLVRRYGLVLPGAVAAAAQPLAIVERLAIDQRRTLLLVRRDGREHLLLVGPDATLLIESAAAADASPIPAAPPSHRLVTRRAA